MARILVVDDDPVIVGFIEKVLKDKGHQVISANGGLEALGKVYAEKFDLAIIDVILPHIDGTRLLEAVKNHRPAAMVIMMSGQATLEVAIDAIKNGAYEFIKKPVRKDELEKIVDNALEEKRLMKNSGYIYKNHRRNNKASIKNGVLYSLTDSLFIAVSFYLGFVMQSAFFEKLELPFLITDSELLKMSLGLAFCYSFIYVLRRSYRPDLIASGRELVGQLWKNLTQSYLVFLAILFLGHNVHFMADRIGIGLGYLTGFLFLYANRFIIMPRAKSAFLREGRKNIVIVGSEKSAAEISKQIRRQPAAKNVLGYINDDLTLREGLGSNARLIASKEDIDKITITDDVEELYIAADTMSSGEILNLLDRFKGRKLKIVILGDKSEVISLADVVTSP